LQVSQHLHLCLHFLFAIDWAVDILDKNSRTQHCSCHC
jgi:hypothetical protein